MSDNLDTLPHSDTNVDTNSSVALFVSLYLVLLAFFILLASMSRPDADRTEVVVDSVNQTFTSTVKPLQSFQIGDQLPQEIGKEMLLSNYFSFLREKIRQSLSLEDIESDIEGNVMIVRVPIASLFSGERDIVRPEAGILLDRLAGEMQGEKAGVKMEMECAVWDKLPTGEGIDWLKQRDVKRAAAIAHALVKRKVPEQILSVGVKESDEAVLAMRFTVRQLDESILRLKMGDVDGQ